MHLFATAVDLRCLGGHLSRFAVFSRCKVGTLVLGSRQTVQQGENWVELGCHPHPPV